jgi:hypothetical protein
VFHRHKLHVDASWLPAKGNVLGYTLLNSPTGSAPHPKRYTVEIHPADGPPFQAQIDVSPYDEHWDDFFYAGAGDVRACLYDPATHAATFDLTDQGNSNSAQMAAADAMEATLLANKPAPLGEAITGPPWVVPAECPGCGAPVDQATMSMALAPKCEQCGAPLPAQPRARF